MYYHIILRIKLKDDDWMTIGNEHKIPWDTRNLIEASSGWTMLNQQSVGAASAFIPYLEKGILELTNSESDYLDYEVQHGLGTIRDTLEFYKTLLEDCKAHPYSELYGNIVP